ncbi:MAG TPA: inositol monophosphatase family protein, partial [Thermoplasmata archaeon]|nr:inositol monophosphatase family protein [Thermoplasmata archaeon]
EKRAVVLPAGRSEPKMVGNPPPTLEVLFRICHSVHEVVRAANSSPHRADVVAMGADGTPTEEIDRLAEAQILATLDQEGVAWDVLSEEIGRVHRGGEGLLVVDPIDGSHNQLRRLPFTALSLAVGKDSLGGIETGVVHDLASGTTYWAERGRGAFRDGEKIRTRAWDPKRELFFVNLGRHATPRAVALAGKGRRIRSLGCASLEMTMVAQGSADAYLFDNDVENRNLRVTDIAAAYRILVEAGGGARAIPGGSLDEFPLDLSRRTPVFAWGDPGFADRAGAEGYV